MGTLYLLSSTDEMGGKIRGLGGVETIMNLLPGQFPEERGEDAPQRTWTINNNNLCFTLRTLRHLTEPDVNEPYYSRIGTGVNLRVVLRALPAWGEDETTKGLVFQVLYNLMREVDNTHDTPHQGPSLHPNKGESADLHLNNTGGGLRGPNTITRAQPAIQTGNRNSHDRASHPDLIQPPLTSPRYTKYWIRILQVLTPEGFILSKKDTRGTIPEVVPLYLGH